MPTRAPQHRMLPHTRSLPTRRPWPQPLQESGEEEEEEGLGDEDLPQIKGRSRQPAVVDQQPVVQQVGRCSGVGWGGCYPGLQAALLALEARWEAEICIG